MSLTRRLTRGAGSLYLVLAFAMVACGGGAAPEAAKPAAPAAKPAEPAKPASEPAKPAASTGSAPAAAGKPATGAPLNIGYAWGVTGPVAEIVAPFSRAVNAYYEYLNANGGAGGRPIKAVEVDTKYQVPLAVEAYKKLKESDKVIAVQLCSTGDTEALAQQINSDKIAVITCSGAEAWTDPKKNPFIFSQQTTYPDQMKDIIAFIETELWKDTSRKPKIAFSFSDNPFGREPIPVGKAFAQKRGWEVGPDAIVANAATDAQSEALKLKQFDPDFVVVNNVTGGGSAIVRGGKQVGLKARFLSINYSFDEPTVKAIGAQAAEGYIGVGTTSFPTPDLPIVQEIKKLAPSLGEPEMRHIQGWTMAKIWATGIANAITANAGKELTGEMIRDGLESIKDLEVGGAIPGSKWNYTKDFHGPTRDAVFYEVKNGKIAPYGGTPKVVKPPAE